MDRYLIVADDFTGANDTGVQLKRRGIDTNVVFSTETIHNSSCSFVIDTESRGISEEEAYNKVKRLLRGVNFSDFKYVIKKVDSTLRGNIAVEVKAVDEAYGSELVLFAPALPDLNRTTVGGIHMLNNIPITQTEMARDPKKPVKEDNIKNILKKVYSEEVTHVPLKTVQSGKIRLSGSRIFTFDAVTNADMKKIIRAGIETGKKVLWVGTAAMADNLLEIEKETHPVLSVVASLSSVTRMQVKYAEQNGMLSVKVPVYNIIEKKVDPKVYIDETVKLLRDGKDVMLMPSSTYDPEEYTKTNEAGKRNGMSNDAVSLFTQNLMGYLARNVLEDTKVSGVFLTGGDTAIGFFDKVGSLGSTIVSEIAIGIPLMKLVGGPFEGLKVVTKAGAFGKEDSIIYAVRKLKEVIK
ncbi:MAG TPA: four-carbon acid sugar kinase family protein [Clostridiaceae bacterium]|nr:four-carbon acid sugar kinase family protein [Clostridiaceae bacterium]